MLMLSATQIYTIFTVQLFAFLNLPPVEADIIAVSQKCLSVCLYFLQFLICVCVCVGGVGVRVRVKYLFDSSYHIRSESEKIVQLFYFYLLCGVLSQFLLSCP